MSETIAPIAEEYDIVVAGTEPSSEDTEIVYGPGGDSTVSIINDHATEQIGPGGTP